MGCGSATLAMQLGASQGKLAWQVLQLPCFFKRPHCCRPPPPHMCKTLTACLQAVTMATPTQGELEAAKSLLMLAHSAALAPAPEVASQVGCGSVTLAMQLEQSQGKLAWQVLQPPLLLQASTLLPCKCTLQAAHHCREPHLRQHLEGSTARACCQPALAAVHCCWHLLQFSAGSSG